MTGIKKIFEYVQKGDFFVLEALKEEGHFIPSKLVLSSSKDSVLHIAVRTGKLQIVKWVLTNGCEVFLEHQNNDGKRPLHEAALLSDADIVDFLLKNGVEIDPLKRNDWTPLMLATAKGELSVIKRLVEGSACLTIRNKDGWTPFHIGCRDAAIEVIEYYLSLKEDIWDSKSKNGRTPLHTSALQGRNEVVKLLLSRAKYSGNEEDSCGNTPLMDAVRSGNLSCVVQLLSKNTDFMRKTDKIGRNPIHLAAEAGQDDIVKLLIRDYSFHVDFLSKNGETSLHYASKENQRSTLKLLITLGADINHRDSKGRTALWKAASSKKEESYNILLLNAAKDLADFDGKRPSEMI